LLRELHALHTLPDPQRRGYMLEALLERAFRHAHFEADHNPKMDPERQTDFAVISHSHRYLVEVKWKSDQAGTPEVDEVRSRLRGGDSTVVGVLFTMLGINEEGVQRIVGHRDYGLVLVFDEADILVALEDPHELERLLRHKHDELAVHGRVELGAQHREARRSPRNRAGKEQQPPDNWPDDLARSGVIICSLRSHHPLSKPKERYELWSHEVARTSDARALRVVAEWWEVEKEPEERMPTAGAAFRYFSVGVGEVFKKENPAPGQVMPGL
jgi:hypothetical protein